MGDLGLGEIASTIICSIEKRADVTHSLSKTQAIWVVEIGLCQKKRLPPECMLHCAEEGVMAPQEGLLEVFFERINVLLNYSNSIAYP
jgi:hypothetical protein